MDAVEAAAVGGGVGVSFADVAESSDSLSSCPNETVGWNRTYSQRTDLESLIASSQCIIETFHGKQCANCTVVSFVVKRV